MQQHSYYNPAWILNCVESEEKTLWVKVEKSPNVFEEGYYMGDGENGTIEVKLVQSQQTIFVLRKHCFQKHSKFSQESIDDTYADMVDMLVLNEPEILYNIQVRYKLGNIYTRIGPTMIIMNPFKYINLLSEDFTGTMIQQLGNYIFQQQVEKISVEAFLDKFPVHIFTLAALSYKNLLQKQRDQAIVFSGESGAGKTVNTGLAMKLLTSLSQEFEKSFGISEDAFQLKTSIEEQVLACNPILETFGNAATVKNYNSSRFGKFVQIFFNESDPKIQGIMIDIYLLEKSRVVHQGPNERNYHIFYYLLNGAPLDDLIRYKLVEQEQDRDQLMKSFRYLGQYHHLPFGNDQIQYNDLLGAFKKMGFLQDQIDSIFKVISCICWIGNLKFDDSTFGNNSPCSSADDYSLNKIAELLQVNSQTFLKSLVYKLRIVQKQQIYSPLTKQDCIQQADALAKLIYEALFQWIVDELNRKLSPSSMGHTISLLDIFGFENFQTNSLEQLCINFTNEKLHQLYTQQIFKDEMDLYKQQGLLQIFEQMEFQDNQNIIDLFEKPPHGIFNILDDTCQMSSMQDSQFVSNIGKAHSQSKPKLLDVSKIYFTVMHTPAKVEYNSEGFKVKNLDQVSQCLLNFLEDAHPDGEDTFTDIVLKQYLIQQKDNFASRKSLTKKFRLSLDQLVKVLKQADLHFVRCIKPNEVKVNDAFDSRVVLKQIKYLGLFESIKMKRQGHEYKFTFDEILQMYGEISRDIRHKGVHNIYPLKDEDKLTIIKESLFDQFFDQDYSKDFAFGVDRIFLKDRAFDRLERLLKAQKIRQGQLAMKIAMQFKKIISRIHKKKAERTMKYVQCMLIKAVTSYKHKKVKAIIEARNGAARLIAFYEERYMKRKVFKHFGELNYQEQEEKRIQQEQEEKLKEQAIEEERLRLEQERLELEGKIQEEENERLRLEQERLEFERLEAERLIQEEAQKQAEIEAEKYAEEERLRHEQIERQRQLQTEAERLAMLIEEERIRQEEIERQKQQQIETERLAQEEQVQERQRQEEAERQRQIQEQIESEREKERQEQQRLAEEAKKKYLAEKEEAERKKREEADKKSQEEKKRLQDLTGDTTNHVPRCQAEILGGKSLWDIVKQDLPKQQQQFRLNSAINSPFSQDFMFDLDSLTPEFVKKVKDEQYIKIIEQMIPKRSKWGKTIYASSQFQYNPNLLDDSLTEIKHKPYVNTIIDPEIKFPKIDKKLQEKENDRMEDFAIKLNKLILKFSHDYSTSQNPQDMVTQMLWYLQQGNLDPFFNRDINTQMIVTNWQLVLIEEFYIQLLRQLVNNKNDEKLSRYLRLLIIVTSYIPTGRRLYFTTLNILYQLIFSQVAVEVGRDAKLVFARIIRNNSPYMDKPVFPRFFRFTQPTGPELGTLISRRQFIQPIFLLNGVQVNVWIESNTTAKYCVEYVLRQLLLDKMPQDTTSFGLVEFNQQSTQYSLVLNSVKANHINDETPILDLIQTWGVTIDNTQDYNLQLLKDGYQATFLKPKHLYLVARTYNLKPQDFGLASLYFIQLHAEVMSGYITLREEDYINLAALKIASETNRIPPDNLNRNTLPYYVPLEVLQRLRGQVNQPALIQAIKESNYIIYQKKKQELPKVNAYCSITNQIGYLKYLEDNPFFFCLYAKDAQCQYFKSIVSFPKEKTMVSLSKDMICLCDLNTKVIKKKIFIQNITNFYMRGRELSIYEGIEDKYVIDTTSVVLFHFALTQYKAQK